ncbi:MAG: hypothetical protein NT027_14210 [Proteobacteria bacterium]|nr:hypothetical protein [Pseudomonadota bacterium]
MKKIIAILPLAFPILYSCGSRSPSNSTLDESPDSANVREQFGLKVALSYDDLKRNQRISLEEIPWSDTYWPLTNKEMAARWQDVGERSTDTVGLANYLETFLAESAKKIPDPNLSPGEKYDIVYQQRFKTSSSSDAIKSIIGQIQKTDQEIAGLTTIPEKKRKLQEMIPALESTEISKAIPMTSIGWSNFLTYSSSNNYKFLGTDDTSSDAEDWGWMGICHGWAAAAVMEKAPKHSVMATINEKEVLFTEGDIRGLLSKAWAQEAPYNKNYFLGRRCNKDVANTNAPIPANSKGKGFAGTIKFNGNETSFTIVETLLDLPVNGPNDRAEVYKISLDGTNESLFVFSKWQQYYASSTYKGLIEYMRRGRSDKVKKIESLEFTGCWDVNPASFHEVLVEQLAVRKVGFVMDRTRNGQVWNQPVYAVEFDIGDLKPVGSVADVAAEYRASGTKYVAEVKALVRWIAEPYDAQQVYESNFDLSQSQKTNYRYTLEFDSNKRIIGGEWGSLSKMDPAGQAPDFIYGYEKDAKPVDNISIQANSVSLDYSGIIGKIHECSLASTTDGATTVNGEEIKYSRCSISTIP